MSHPPRGPRAADPIQSLREWDEALAAAGLPPIEDEEPVPTRPDDERLTYQDLVAGDVAGPVDEPRDTEPWWDGTSGTAPPETSDEEIEERTPPRAAEPGWAERVHPGPAAQHDDPPPAAARAARDAFEDLVATEGAVGMLTPACEDFYDPGLGVSEDLEWLLGPTEPIEEETDLDFTPPRPPDDEPWEEPFDDPERPLDFG